MFSHQKGEEAQGLSEDVPSINMRLIIMAALK
jgi:hypothetical protein